MDLVEEIEHGLRKSGKSRIGLAKALGRSPSVITEMLRKNGKRRHIKSDEIEKIREYLELDPVVPIVGSVGASSEEVYYGENADDPAEYAPAPSNASPETVAVVVRGESLGRGFNGWLAYYNDRRSPITPDLYNVPCVVALDDGRVLIKTPRPAPGGRFHLLSIGTGEIIHDAKLIWAARVILMQPGDTKSR